MPTTDQPARGVRPPDFPRSRWWRMSRAQRRDYTPPSFIDIMRATDRRAPMAAVVEALNARNQVAA